MFHGVYDFAYLLKNVTNLPLPDEEILFIKNIETYFPNFYDVRYLINNNNLLWMKGSLNKMANLMDIKRLGCTHQAGSDSLITSKLFFKLIETYNDHVDIVGDKNKIYGLNYGYDEYDSINANTMIPPLNNTYVNNFKTGNNYNPISINYSSESNFNLNGNSLMGNQNLFGRVNNVNINNSQSYSLNNNLNNNNLNQHNNLQQILRNSNSPSKFVLTNQSNINRNSMINLQAFVKNNGNTGNNMIYYPSQNGYNNMTHNYSTPYNYNTTINYGNGSFISNNNNNNLSSHTLHKNGYIQQGDYNNYMNQYYIQSGYKNNNNNIATI